MIVYKLTDDRHRTYNSTQWGEGVEHTASGEGELCGPGWLHAYEDPRIAVLMNPGHSVFRNPILWEADGDVGIRDRQLKLGCTRLKTIRQMELPKITTEQKVRFAIECAKQVCHDKEWNAWANKWISGEDRSREMAAEWVTKDTMWTETNAVGAMAAAANAASAAASMAAGTKAEAAWAAWAAAKWAEEEVEWAVADTVLWTANVVKAEAAVASTDVVFDIYAAMEKAGISWSHI